MKKQFFAACFVLLSAACASEQTTESTAIILDEHNMTDHTGTDFDLSAQVLKWDFILLEQNDSCRLTDIARIRFADDDIFAKCPWAHLDVAGTAQAAGGGKGGGTARPLPLLLEWLLSRAPAPKVSKVKTEKVKATSKTKTTAK